MTTSVAGVGVDATGQPVGYISVCNEHIDGATLYYDDPSGSDEDRSVDVGSWTADRSITSLASWSLRDPEPEMTSTTPLTDLKPGVTYTLYGWTKDNSGSTSDIVFTSERLADLEPGQVLFFAGYDEKSDTDRYQVGTTRELESACSN